MYFYFRHTPPMSTEEITSYVKKNNENSFTWFSQDENNTEYQKYLEWVSEGNEAELWDPEVNNG